MIPENKNSSLQDEKEIDEITRKFFNLFTNTGNRTPNVRLIKNLFQDEGIIVNNTSGKPEVYDLESFIKPREEILTNGSLTNFEEKETSHSMEIHGNIAQRMCKYEKSGTFNGEAFTGGGTKLMQFLKSNDQWSLISVIWSDDSI